MYFSHLKNKCVVDTENINTIFEVPDNSLQVEY